jgi:hypothetical protein
MHMRSCSQTSMQRAMQLLQLPSIAAAAATHQQLYTATQLLCSASGKLQLAVALAQAAAA